MFPFSTDSFELKNGTPISVDQAHQCLRGLLTPDRVAKIEAVVSQRNFNSAIVMENIYDRGNMSAVLRTTEAFGIGSVHVIELSDKMKESQRTTAGADKWLEVQRWKSTKFCFEKLRAEGKKIYVTHLDAKARAIQDVDWSQPSALVLGNEKEGISAEAVALADQSVIIPMKGFVQSFNISVAAAICLAEVSRASVPPLTELQQKRLALEYFYRTLDSADDILTEWKRRN